MCTPSLPNGKFLLLGKLSCRVVDAVFPDYPLPFEPTVVTDMKIVSLADALRTVRHTSTCTCASDYGIVTGSATTADSTNHARPSHTFSRCHSSIWTDVPLEDVRYA